MDGGIQLNSDWYGEDYFDGGKGYHVYNDADHFSRTADDIIRLFKPKSVLEIGCAKGFLVKALREKGVLAYGIDISEYAIDKAPEEVKDFLFVHDVTSGKRMQFPKCDLVISFDTFEHLPEKDLPNVWNFLDNYDEAYIRVGTLHTPDWQHDPSHITMHTLEWWEKQYTEAIWEESK